ncbi:MAG: hypothetical protein Q8Q09_09145 [Deltaproteobacteria bacterium]|nr:hypothetical protein [Deltaproteobacteria bacterium]
MITAGLVLTLAHDEALAPLADFVCVTVGELQPHNRLPIATQCDSLESQQALWDELITLPGVLTMDLVFEDFSDVEDFSSEQLPSRWKRREREGRTHDLTDEISTDLDAEEST